jgi:Cysteine rich repeat
MMVRRLTLASLLSLAAVSLAGSALAQSEALALCKSDVARLCPGVQPGGGRILDCLKAHKMEMSVGCAQALQKMKAKMGK